MELISPVRVPLRVKNGGAARALLYLQLPTRKELARDPNGRPLSGPVVAGGQLLARHRLVLVRHIEDDLIGCPSGASSTSCISDGEGSACPGTRQLPGFAINRQLPEARDRTVATCWREHQSGVIATLRFLEVKKHIVRQHVDTTRWDCAPRRARTGPSAGVCVHGTRRLIGPLGRDVSKKSVRFP